MRQSPHGTTAVRETRVCAAADAADKQQPHLSQSETHIR